MDELQKQLNAEYQEAEIAILGVNETGYDQNNEGICEGRDLPWLQDTVEADWWGYWDVTYRDMVILDRRGQEAAIFNLTEHDLHDPNEFELLKDMLLAIAEQ